MRLVFVICYTFALVSLSNIPSSSTSSNYDAECPGSSTNYYVDYEKSGVKCTTPTNACPTLARALTNADSGDLIYIKYHRDYTPAHLGATITRPVTITHCASKHPVLKLTSNCFVVTFSPEQNLDSEVALDWLFIQDLDVLIYAGNFVSVTNTASVRLDRITFYRAEEDTTIDTNLISAVSGQLKLSEVKVFGLTLRDSSVVYLGVGALTIQYSEFHRITSTGSGAVIRATAGNERTFTFTRTTFDTCESSGNGGAVQLHLQAKATLTSSGTTFTSCTAGGDGGAMHITMGTQSHITGAAGAISITGCKAKRNGGGVHFVFSDYVCMDISSISISSCTASSYGHFVCASTSYDTHVSRSTSFWYDFVDWSQPGYFYPFIPNAFVILKTGNNAGTYQMIDIGNYAVVKNKDNQPTTDCQIFTQPCASITSAAATLNNRKYDYRIRLEKGTHEAETYGITFTGRMMIVGGSVKAEETVLAADREEGNLGQAILFFTGEQRDYSKAFALIRHISFAITSTSSAQLDIPVISSSVPLCLTDCRFYSAEKAATALPTSVVAASSDLFIDGCQFSNIKLESSPLIYYDNPNANYKQCPIFLYNKNFFTTITRVDASQGGAIFQFPSLSNYTSFELTSSSFTSCSSAGSGGVLYAQVLSHTFSIGETSLADYVSNGPVSFSSCSSSDAAGKGGVMYLEIHEPTNKYSSPTPVISSLYTSFTTTTAAIGTAVYLNISARTVIPPIFFHSLKEFQWKEGECYIYRRQQVQFDILTWEEPVLTVAPREKEEEEPEYDEESKQYYTIRTAYKSLEEDITPYDGYQIQMLKGTHYCELVPLSFSVPVTISGEDQKETIKQVKQLKDNDNFDGDTLLFRVRNSGHNCTIRLLSFVIFSLEEGCPLDCLFLSVEGTCNLENVTITEQPAPEDDKLYPLQNSLISSTSGLLTLRYVDISSFTLNNVPLIQPNLQKGKFVTLALSTYTSITRKQGSGSVFNIQLQDDNDNFNLTDSIFTSCRTKNGNGGAVYISLNSPEGTPVSTERPHLTLCGPHHILRFINCRSYITGAEGTEACTAEKDIIPDPVLPSDDQDEEIPDEEEEEEAEPDPNVAAGGGLYIDLEYEPFLNEYDITGMSFSDCTAGFGTQFYAYSQDKELAYDTYLWRNLLNRRTAANEFVLSTVSTLTSPDDITDKNSKQAQSVVPYYVPEEEEKSSKWWIAIVVIVVLIVVVVFVLFLIYLRRKIAESRAEHHEEEEQTPQETSLIADNADNDDHEPAPTEQNVPSVESDE